MKKDRQTGHSRKNTANIGGAAYAPQQDEPNSKGDERTPNKPIGEVAYANETRPKRRRGSLDGKFDPQKAPSVNGPLQSSETQGESLVSQIGWRLCG
jgi:hypothetical protein